jgi:hypothetical protein
MKLLTKECAVVLRTHTATHESATNAHHARREKDESAPHNRK